MRPRENAGVRTPFASVAADSGEVAAARAGDDLVADADVVMDRGVDLPASPEQVWPWLVQLGKDRAGWYLPGRVERLLPARHRALRRIDPRWQALAPGDRVPDYGGPTAYFEAVALAPAEHLVYRSRRGRMRLSWSLTLSAAPTPTGLGTRLHLRLRLAPVRRVRLARTLGELVDAVTVAAMAAGLRERLREQLREQRPHRPEAGEDPRTS